MSCGRGRAGHIPSLSRSGDFKLNISPLRSLSFLISKIKMSLTSQSVCEDENKFVRVIPSSLEHRTDS